MITTSKSSISIALLTTIALFVACVTKAKAPGTEGQALIGNWEWIKSSGGMTGAEETAAETKTTKLLSFSKEGAVILTVNGKQELKDTYSSLRVKSIYSNAETDAIRYNTNAMVLSYKISNDTLFLSEECHDCYSHIYKRKK